MSLIHIGVALGLSAGAALVVTGVAMRPIKTDGVAGCVAVPYRVASDSVCMTTGGIRFADNIEGGSSLRLDTDQRDHGQRFRGVHGDCHRDVRTHFVPGYGGVISHLHVGADCKVRKAYRSGSG